MSKTDNLTDFLTDVANSIRTKKDISSTTKINPQDFSSQISSIDTPVLQEKTVYPRDSIVTVTPDYARGYNGLFKVNVDAIPDMYLRPITILEFGETYTLTTGRIYALMWLSGEKITNSELDIYITDELSYAYSATITSGTIIYTYRTTGANGNIVIIPPDIASSNYIKTGIFNAVQRATISNDYDDSSYSLAIYQL